MKEPSRSHHLFEETLSTENCTDLTSTFFDSEEQRKKLASFYIQSASFKIGEIVDEKEVLGILEHALDLTPHSASHLHEIARLYFRLGVRTQKPSHLFIAKGLLHKVIFLDPNEIKVKKGFWHLFGRLYLELYHQLKEEVFLTLALQKFERGESEMNERVEDSSRFFWDFATAWFLLGSRSGEISDMKRSAEKMAMAAAKGACSQAFRMDYGDVLYVLGLRTSDERLLKGALLHYLAATEGKEVQAPSWRAATRTAKEICFFTGSEVDLKRADKLFSEAILSVPEYADFWLEWGDLYLRFGWINKDASFIEKGLEKLTSLKIGECSPLFAASLIGLGMSMMGFFLDDFSLLREGRARIFSALQFEGNFPALHLSLGFSDFIYGLYFGDFSYLERAIDTFNEAIEKENRFHFLYFGCYEAYVALAIAIGERKLLDQGLHYLSKLIQFRPHFPQLYLSSGIALLRFAQLENEETIDEAIDAFEKALFLDRSETALYHYAIALTLHGNVRGEEKSFEEALRILTELCEKNPKIFTFHFQRAITLSHFGEFLHDEDLLWNAVHILETLKVNEGENEVLNAELGYTHLLLSQWIENKESQESLLQKAEEELQMAAKNGHEEASFHLACLYSLTGLFEKSLAFLERALSCGIINEEEMQEDEWLEDLLQSEIFLKNFWLKKKRENKR